MKKFFWGLLALILLSLMLVTCADPVFAYVPPQTATAPITLSNTNVIACPTCATTSGVVTTWAGGTTGLLPSAATSGAITVTGTLIGANGGTGVNNSGKTITLGGNLTTSGAFASTFTMTGITGVTFPTSGTLATTAQLTFASLSGQATNAQLATQTANTVLGALTATTPSGLAVPSCSTASSALTWTTGTGFGCNSIAGGGTVTTVSVTTANGVSGVVATPTSTPAITLTLGAITPSSVASTGAVSGTTLAASSTSAFTGNVGIGQAAGADALDVTGNANFTGTTTATTGNVISSAGNGVFTVQGLESSGTGAGIRVRDSMLGTIGYLAMNSYVQGGTGYAQLDLQAAQGTVCISGGGLGSTTPGASCGILVGTSNGITLASALPVASGGTGDTGTAWSQTTPVPTCSVGTPTTISSIVRVKTIGKSAFITLTVTDTANGTCATAINVGLPFTAGSAALLVCRETVNTGLMATGTIAAAGTGVQINKYDNTFPGGTGNVITCSGVAETQ